MSMQGWPAMGGQATVLQPGAAQPGNGNGVGAGVGFGGVNPGVMVPGVGSVGAQPTGQIMVPTGNQTAYGIANLPPAPAPQQMAPATGFVGQVPMGPQGQYGLPGAYGQPQGYQAGMPGYGQMQGQLFNPQQPVQQTQSMQFPQQGNGVPGAGYVQQPQGWPQQVQGQPQVQAQVNPQTRLDGPNVPAELRGRTIGEAMAIYNSMATLAQGYGRSPALGQQQVQGQPQQPVVSQQAQQAQQAPGSFWQNPDQRFEQILERVIDQRMGPVVQFTQTQALAGARMAAQQQIPDFGQLEAEVQQMVANAQPEALANPNIWIGAADIVRGRQMREGRYQPVASQNQGGYAQQPQGLGLPQPRPDSTQLPPGAFFTEAPAAPSPTGMAGAPAQPTAQDVAMAQKFNMPIGEYMGWKYGVQPAMVPNPGSTFVGQQQPTAPWHYGPYAGGGAGGVR